MWVTAEEDDQNIARPFLHDKSNATQTGVPVFCCHVMSWPWESGRWHKRQCWLFTSPIANDQHDRESNGVWLWLRLCMAEMVQRSVSGGQFITRARVIRPETTFWPVSSVSTGYLSSWVSLLWLWCISSGPLGALQSAGTQRISSNRVSSIQTLTFTYAFKLFWS